MDWYMHCTVVYCFGNILYLNWLSSSQCFIGGIITYENYIASDTYLDAKVWLPKCKWCPRMNYSFICKKMTCSTSATYTITMGCIYCKLYCRHSILSFSWELSDSVIIVQRLRWRSREPHSLIGQQIVREIDMPNVSASYHCNNSKHCSFLNYCATVQSFPKA